MTCDLAYSSTKPLPNQPLRYPDPMARLLAGLNDEGFSHLLPESIFSSKTRATISARELTPSLANTRRK